MQLKITIGRCDCGDGVLVDQDVSLNLHQNGKIVEGFDIPFHFVPRHELDEDTDVFFPGLVKVLILNVEWRFSHVPLL